MFEGVNEDIQVWPDALGRTSWLRRFLDYLRDRGRLADFSFFSFEHYPYEPCRIQWSSLYDEPELIGHILQVWRDDGLPPGTPLFVTEVEHLVGRAPRTPSTSSALSGSADYIGAFFTAGGDAYYYFHYIPTGLHPGCNDSPGTFGMFTVDADYQHPAADVPVLRQPDSQPGVGRARRRRAPRLSREERRPGRRRQRPRHRLCVAASGRTVVGAVDQQGPDPPPSVSIAFRDEASSRDGFFAGPVSLTTFGSAQYRWHPEVKGGWADPDGPALRASIAATADTVFALPEASINVVRGRRNTR